MGYLLEDSGERHITRTAPQNPDSVDIPNEKAVGTEAVSINRIDIDIMAAPLAITATALTPGLAMFMVGMDV